MQADEKPDEEMNVIKIDAETMTRIGKALEDWQSVAPEVRATLEETLQNSDEIAERLIDAVSATERLSEEDLAIRINTRD